MQIGRRSLGGDLLVCLFVRALVGGMDGVGARGWMGGCIKGLSVGGWVGLCLCVYV